MYKFVPKLILVRHEGRRHQLYKKLTDVHRSPPQEHSLSVAPTHHAPSLAVGINIRQSIKNSGLILTEQGLTSDQTHYRSYWGRFLWVK